MTLKEFFKAYPKVAIAFSGGVDSAYLLHEAKMHGADIKAYFVKSQFQPEFELEDARRLADQLQVEMEIIPLDVLHQKEICSNPANRCYFCKREIFTALRKAAEKDGYTILLDGTNGSDDAGSRPGMRVLREMKVLSPLQLCEMTKEEIRVLSKKAGLFTWDKPAYACLATRIPTGTEITGALLEKIEKAEEILFQMGFTDFRIRLFHGAGRIQLPACQMGLAIEKREEILKELKPYFSEIFLDLEGR